MSSLKLVQVFLLAIVAVATPALADGKSGLMVGGSVGTSVYDVDNLGGTSVDLEDGDFAWKVILGYRFGLFAIEGDYRDFGEVSDSKTGATFSTQAFDVSGALMLPLGPFDVIGRVGASAWDGDASVGGVSLPSSFDGTNLMYGIGGAFRLGAIAIRVEIERFEFDPEPVNMASVGATFTF